jgi:tetratricopeptide (TPR) repeat protein
MRVVGKIVVLAVAACLIVIAARAYLGYHFFYKYGAGRGEAQSLDKSFPELEKNLRRAVAFSKNPLFYQEMGRLYLEMALAENKFGTPEKRDDYLNLAGDSLAELLKRNPAEAFGYYEMGKVYMLYNFPLLTYASKARQYFNKALELRPLDEELNVNVVYIYLTQWDILSHVERAFVFEAVTRNLENNESFFPQVKKLWVDEFGDVERLKAIFANDPNFWPKISRYFSN